jgi:hypothetical protein
MSQLLTENVWNLVNSIGVVAAGLPAWLQWMEEAEFRKDRRKDLVKQRLKQILASSTLYKDMHELDQARFLKRISPFLRIVTCSELSDIAHRLWDSTRAHRSIEISISRIKLTEDLKTGTLRGRYQVLRDRVLRRDA